MTGLEVFLIIVGIACICISFFISRGISGEEMELSHSGSTAATEVWTEKDEEMVRQRIEDILSGQQEEYVESAKEEMGRLCNEKIMAVDEFSSQILEKINNNHQEVVFMYNMLNEKQKELKMVMSASVKPEEKNKESKETETAPSVSRTVKQEKPVQKQLKSPKEAAAPTGLSQVKKTSKKNPVPHSVPKEKAVSPAVPKQPETSVPGNVNLQIQKMYKEGKSVLEISKALDIGQGEVKLVIALYGGRKG